MITNSQTRTNVNEIADGIYRVNTPVHLLNGQAFSFNQYLIVDDEPLLFHTGPRRMFPLVREAVGAIMPVEHLRYVAVSHFEADECGSLDLWLAAASEALPVCGRIAAMVSVSDVVDRPPRALSDGEELSLGRHALRWYDTPHVPHGWDCGLMMEVSTNTFLCGDLFTQPGRGDQALTEGDILGPSESFRQPMDYFSHAPHTAATILRLSQLKPTTLACMHGSAWRGDGGALLQLLAEAVTARA